MKTKTPRYENVYPAGDIFLAFMKEHNLTIDLEKLKELERRGGYEKGHWDAHTPPWMRCC